MGVPQFRVLGCVFQVSGLEVDILQTYLLDPVRAAVRVSYALSFSELRGHRKLRFLPGRAGKPVITASCFHLTFWYTPLFSNWDFFKTGLGGEVQIWGVGSDIVIFSTFPLKGIA